MTIQRVIELTFADEDVTVSTVGDGQAAIDRLETDPPDIVLADVDMPKRPAKLSCDHLTHDSVDPVDGVSNDIRVIGGPGCTCR